MICTTVPPIYEVMIEEIIRRPDIELAPLAPNGEKTALMKFSPRFHTRTGGGLAGESCWDETSLPSIKTRPWTLKSERLAHTVDPAHPMRFKETF
jgi:hypothetical protein